MWDWLQSFEGRIGVGKYQTLRAALRESKITQNDVAYRLGCTPEHVSRIMNGYGKAQFTLAQVAILAKLVSARIEDLPRLFPELGQVF